MKNIAHFAAHCCVVLAGSSLLLAACNSSEVESSTTTVALNQVTLGLLTRTQFVRNSDGSRDSSIAVQYAANGYTLHIDTLQRTIANVDSLPYGTDLSKVRIGKISTTGQYTIKALSNGADSTLTLNTDLDFTQPRTLSVYPTGYSKSPYRQDYTFRLLVHQQNGDSVVWTAMTKAQFDALSLPQSTAGLVQAQSGTYKIADGQIYRTTDQTSWISMAVEAANSDKIPSENISGTALSARNNAQIEEVYFYGTQNVSDTQAVARLWKGNVDLQGRYSTPWFMIEATNVAALNAPALHSAHLLSYDGALLLAGIDSSQQLVLRTSNDRGRTWQKATQLTAPEDFGTVQQLDVVVDNAQLLYIVVNKEKVWRGRLNRLGWTKQ